MHQQLNDALMRLHFAFSLQELRKDERGDTNTPALSRHSMVYLGIIAFMDRPTVSTLAERLHITKAAVTLKINELERQGLLYKERSTEDRRVSYLRIAPHVATIIAEQANPMYGAMDEIEREFPAEAIANFCSILAIFTNAIEKERH